MVGRRVRMPVDGLLLLDKPLGWSSNQALKKAQRHHNAIANRRAALQLKFVDGGDQVFTA